MRVLHFLIVFVASTAVLVLGGCCQRGSKRFNVLVASDGACVLVRRANWILDREKKGLVKNCQREGLE